MTSMFRGLLTGFIVALTVLPAPAQTAPVPEIAASDLRTIQGRYTDFYLGQTSKPEDLQKARDLMQADGGYPDLDYKAKDDVNLPCFAHLQRLGDLAAAYRGLQSPFYGKAELKTQISRGLDYWFAADPHSGNWWYNDIGAPSALAKVLFLFNAELTDEQRHQGIDILKRGYTDGRCVFGNPKVAGQNLLWIADLLIQAGALEGNYEFASRAAQAVAQEIKIAKGREGVQPDMSFHQHGAMLYSGGYGKAFPVFVTQIASILRGTSLALPSEKLDLVARYLFDGEQWMIRGTNFDFGTIGRAIARKQEGANAGQIARALRLLREAQPAYANTADVFAQRVQGKVPPGEGVQPGNRMFWNSDYMCQQQPNYLACIKAVSTRTVGSESGNREALKNYYMSTGVMCLMKTGKEYEGIFPLWNWRMLPGITCAQSAAPIKEINWGKGSEGTSAFVGGASDGAHGVLAYDFRRDGISAHKAWFCFGDEIFCLGSGIRSDMPGPVLTTMEQNWHVGDVWAGKGRNSTPIVMGETANLDGCRWLLHGTTGYVFPEAQKVKASIEQRTGAWREIGANESPAPVTGEVFTAWIEHGTAPQDGTYAYAVLPHTTPAEIKSYTIPEILSNTPQRQAVWNARLKLLGTVFYEPGQLTLPAGYGTFEVDKPCVLLARANGNSWTISVADPTQTLQRIEVTLRGRTRATLMVDLPQGDLAGSTARAELEGTQAAVGLTALTR